MELHIAEMMDMQRQLQEKYFEYWGGLNKRKGRDQILWAIIEAGEAADIIKKWGDDAIMENSEQRKHFVEEIGDVIMYLMDVLRCYEIPAEYFAREYRAKWTYNMTRWKEKPEGQPGAEETTSLSVPDMFHMQAALQEKYFDKWGGLEPRKGRDCILWGIIEAGEAADIIKKWGDDAIMENEEQRKHFTEEIGDVIMFLVDTLICYGVTADEFTGEYRGKWTHNMKRW